MLLTLELRRLEGEIRRVEQGDAPHQAARLRAVLAAYDQLLIQLCQQVEVPTDGVGLPPLPSRERVTLEASSSRPATTGERVAADRHGIRDRRDGGADGG